MFYIISFFALLIGFSIFYIENKSNNNSILHSSFISYEWLNNILKNISLKLLKSLIVAFILLLFTGELPHSATSGSEDTEQENMKTDNTLEESNKSNEESNKSNEPSNTSNEPSNTNNQPSKAERNLADYYLSGGWEAELHRLMAEHTEQQNKEIDLEIKKDNLHTRDDEELTKEELEKKNELFKQREQNVSWILSENLNELKITESIAAQNRPEGSNNDVGSSQNKRALDEDNSEANKKNK